MERVEMHGDVIVAVDESLGRDLTCEVRAVKGDSGVIEVLSVDYFRDGERIVGPLSGATG